MKKTISQAAQVHYRVSVLDARGREVRTLPRRRNLILNQGLDGIAVRTWVASFTSAAVGTGTTPTKRDSGAITFARSGTLVTASAGFFEAADVGRLLKFDSGEEMYVTTFHDALTVTVGTSGTLAASEGTMWYVNQTGLTAESKRSSTVSSPGSTYLAGTWTHTRTFLFSAETGTVNYREIGWSHSPTAGANLFGRDLLAGVGVTLVANQQLRVTVELAVSYSPVVPTAYTNVITGWSANGTCGIEYVGSEGVQTLTQLTGPLDPSTAGQIAILTDSTAIRAAAPSGMILSGLVSAKSATLSSYTSGGYSIKKTATFAVTEGNSTNIRSVQLASPTGGTSSIFRVLLASAESKTNTQTLSIEFTLNWGRVLVN